VALVSSLPFPASSAEHAGGVGALVTSVSGSQPQVVHIIELAAKLISLVYVHFIFVLAAAGKFGT